MNFAWFTLQFRNRHASWLLYCSYIYAFKFQSLRLLSAGNDLTEKSNGDKPEMSSTEVDKAELERRQRTERYKEQRRLALSKLGSKSIDEEIPSLSPTRKRQVSMKTLMIYFQILMHIKRHKYFSKFHRLSWKSACSFISTSKSKILEKSDQNWSCNNSALLGWRATKFGRPAVFGWLNLFLACCNFSFGLIFLKFWI